MPHEDFTGQIKTLLVLRDFVIPRRRHIPPQHFCHLMLGHVEDVCRILQRHPLPKISEDFVARDQRVVDQIVEKVAGQHSIPCGDFSPIEKGSTESQSKNFKLRFRLCFPCKHQFPAVLNVSEQRRLALLNQRTHCRVREQMRIERDLHVFRQRLDQRFQKGGSIRDLFKLVDVNDQRTVKRVEIGSKRLCHAAWFLSFHRRRDVCAEISQHLIEFRSQACKHLRKGGFFISSHAVEKDFRALLPEKLRHEIEPKFRPWIEENDTLTSRLLTE